MVTVYILVNIRNGALPPILDSEEKVKPAKSSFFAVGEASHVLHRFGRHSCA